ncbi:hypothetical protein E4U43_006319 [Claviceps pusilla]|uniref:Secreted protein n=1 Tax=Claviceps pusilla TaxID=123648 RepID=A0A9P7T295_9HYPO|nr:hypothetical protein E4U43_006319 [Claviceps pusilla]
MQFSTSAALAVVALFAGQSLANGCSSTIDGTVFQGDHSICTSAAGPNTWKCGRAGTVVGHLGSNTWLVHSGSTRSVVNISCRDAGGKHHTLDCPPNTWGYSDYPDLQDCKTPIVVSHIQVTM